MSFSRSCRPLATPFDSIRKVLFWIGSGILFTACMEDVDLPYPPYVERYVLNGVLNPDSIISITLRKTLPPLSDDSTGYVPIANAKVLCYRNGLLLGPMVYRDNSRYEFPETQPEAGGVYRIEATVENTTLSATDTVPTSISYKLGGLPYKITSQYRNPDLDLTFLELTPGTKYVWLSFINRLSERDFGDTVDNFRNVNGIVGSISPYLDDFNATRQDGGVLQVYSFMARIKPSALGQGTLVFAPLSFTGAYRRPGTRLTLHVSNFSQAYDRYLKTAITALDNPLINYNGVLNNPFYEPINVYSNVQNGLGILGAVNDRSQVIIQN